ncbi:PP0621 family protein [Burkholderia guangdongensis]|uniref:PP0621 family protein n=1 Tax=Burkholderia guangdongensis TaxID=1792500 RepID=UPI0015CDEF42|nr:PP0621 family protein [Burkholderia guangdongensis]
MRQILLLILIFFASSWIARKLRQMQSGPRAPRDGATGGVPGSGGRGGPARGGMQSLPEPMVRCAECGVHAPKGDAVIVGGEYFCSAEHAARHAAHAADRDPR